MLITLLWWFKWAAISHQPLLILKSLQNMGWNKQSRTRWALAGLCAGSEQRRCWWISPVICKTFARMRWCCNMWTPWRSTVWRCRGLHRNWNMWACAIRFKEQPKTWPMIWVKISTPLIMIALVLTMSLFTLVLKSVTQMAVWKIYTRGWKP